MRVTYYFSIAMLVILTGCSRSSSPPSSSANLTNALESALVDGGVSLAEFAKLTNELETSLARGHTLVKREIILSMHQPSDSFLGARLVEIASDGTTTIEILKTSNRLQAAVGAFFTSPEYGRSGLQVLSASSGDRRFGWRGRGASECAAKTCIAAPWRVCKSTSRRCSADDCRVALDARVTGIGP